MRKPSQVTWSHAARDIASSERSARTAGIIGRRMTLGGTRRRVAPLGVYDVSEDEGVIRERSALLARVRAGEPGAADELRTKYQAWIIPGPGREGK